nr:MAG: hypothetical protein [Microvirus sp.]
MRLVRGGPRPPGRGATVRWRPFSAPLLLLLRSKRNFRANFFQGNPKAYPVDTFGGVNETTSHKMWLLWITSGLSTNLWISAYRNRRRRGLVCICTTDTPRSVS